MGRSGKVRVRSGSVQGQGMFRERSRKVHQCKVIKARSRQSQGKKKARSREGQGKFKVTSRQGKTRVKVR